MQHNHTSIDAPLSLPSLLVEQSLGATCGASSAAIAVAPEEGAWSLKGEKLIDTPRHFQGLIVPFLPPPPQTKTLCLLCSRFGVSGGLESTRENNTNRMNRV